MGAGSSHLHDGLGFLFDSWFHFLYCGKRRQFLQLSKDGHGSILLRNLFTLPFSFTDKLSNGHLCGKALHVRRTRLLGHLRKTSHVNCAVTCHSFFLVLALVDTQCGFEIEIALKSQNFKVADRCDLHL